MADAARAPAKIVYVIQASGGMMNGYEPVAKQVANAIADATGRRLRDLPMSPPKVLAALGDVDPEPQRLAAKRGLDEWMGVEFKFGGSRIRFFSSIPIGGRRTRLSSQSLRAWKETIRSTSSSPA